MVAEHHSRRKGVAYEALNLFMAYTVKHLVSTLLKDVAQRLNLLHCFCRSHIPYSLHCSIAYESKRLRPYLQLLYVFKMFI